MNSKVIGRYSQALFDAAEKAKLLKPVSGDSEGLISLIKSDEAFRLYLNSPVIKIDKKKRIAKALFEKRVNKLIMNFILLLIDRGREYLLSDILKDFLVRKDDHDGIIRPVYKGTYELDSTEKQKLINVLEKYSGLKCQPWYAIEENLIGGSTIQVGDTIIDNSIKRQLELLREKLKTKL